MYTQEATQQQHQHHGTSLLPLQEFRARAKKALYMHNRPLHLMHLPPILSLQTCTRSKPRMALALLLLRAAFAARYATCH